LSSVQGDRDAAALKLAQLAKDLEAVKEAKALAEEGLTLRGREAAAQDKKLTAAMARVATLESQVRERDTQAAAASQKMEGLEGKLTNLETRAKELRALAELLPGLREKLKEAQERSAAGEARMGSLEKEVSQLKEYRDRLAAEEALAKSLEKEIKKRLGELEARNRDLMLQKQALETAQHNIRTLQGEKKILRAEAERVRAAVENRFAGMALTGRRVVFIVDMSGSMELVEQNRPAPDKWIGVRETLARIMRSLPELEKFQVLLFSSKVSYLLGYEGVWIDYDQDSAKRVAEALSRVKPDGGTNLYSAFEAAFRFRSMGMDTLYLLSDGLPNLGEGLSADAARTMKETEVSDILSKHIRKKLLSDWNAPVPGLNRVRINAVGFFYESPDVGAVLWALTRENDGSFVGMSKP
jgi:archaellum component FlaC